MTFVVFVAASFLQLWVFSKIKVLQMFHTFLPRGKTELLFSPTLFSNIALPT